MNAYTPGSERMMERLYDTLRENDRRRYAAVEATKPGTVAWSTWPHSVGVRSQDHRTRTNGTGRGEDPAAGRVRKKGVDANDSSTCPQLEANFLKMLVTTPPETRWQRSSRPT